jgi:hypothetical protein
MTRDPQAAFKDHFGRCPHCKNNDGFYNVSRSHWFFCREHRVQWFVGSNLFSCWRKQTEGEQRQYYDANGFGSYEEVEPFHRPPVIVTVAPEGMEGPHAKTCRSVAWNHLSGAICQLVDDNDGRQSLEDAQRLGELQAAFAEFRLKFNAAVDAIPVMAEVLNRPLPVTVIDNDECPF